ncbi:MULTISPECIES: hypothetical protein [unclassified Rhodococcus (in: high G+C Gram-positive bacteria)]|uniref:hypothetical protein n=1 Tax=unclassified Rhodococcus (in: high G+C Gram-positive bacteria) TaxID=192944 RepID=UPI00096A91EE|nr:MULTISPECIES: hypothetical protein [unclassified Rhodococcus (in: high G+C Gram-positive bacteria)]
MTWNITSREKGSAINSPRPASADVALALAAATVLGITVGVLLADMVAGVSVGAGTAVVFRFVPRTIITRK